LAAGPASWIIRPLLTVARAEIVDYLAGLGQPFRTDSSNADPRFTRNRIRAELLPLLKTFNPEVVNVLGRLAQQADEAHAVIAEQARDLLQQAERPRAGGLVILDPEALGGSQGYLIGEVFRLIWEREGWPTGEMTADHWNRAVEVARGERAAAEFPGRVTARHVGRVVQLGRRE
jgi:tRNA(Ile)-lysidine synthase